MCIEKDFRRTVFFLSFLLLFGKKGKFFSFIILACGWRNKSIYAKTDWNRLSQYIGQVIFKTCDDDDFFFCIRTHIERKINQFSIALFKWQIIFSIRNYRGFLTRFLFMDKGDAFTDNNIYIKTSLEKKEF